MKFFKTSFKRFLLFVYAVNFSVLLLTESVLMDFFYTAIVFICWLKYKHTDELTAFMGIIFLVLFWEKVLEQEQT